MSTDIEQEEGAKPAPPDPKLLLDPVCFVALGLGSGMSKWAPGTAGTLAGMLVAWLLADWSVWALLAVALVSIPLGVWICGYCSEKMGVHDHSAIVFDEFSGVWIALIAVPLAWQWWLAVFVLFRFFDILKPWPISWADRNLVGGLGIMLDDIMAGVATLGIIHLCLFLL